MTTYKPHPDDSSLVIGDNGHVYAATRLPETGPCAREAWDILDKLAPGTIPNKVRLFLAGIIAGTLDRVTTEGLKK